MPPFVPRKRLSSPEPSSSKRQATSSATQASKPVVEVTNSREFDSNSDSDSDLSLSDAPPEGQEKDDKDDDGDDDDENIDWEDAMGGEEEEETAALEASLKVTDEPQDMELTLGNSEVHIADVQDGKKAPSKIERQIRIQTHCMHVQCLLFHNALRNSWINDAKVHDILRHKLPPGIKKEIHKWRIASGLEVPDNKQNGKQQERVAKEKGKGKKKTTRKQERDWAEQSLHVEPGKPDTSRGDPIISLLKVLAAFWKKQFKIAAPGLRKYGYRPMSLLEAQVSSFHKEDHDAERFGERICNLEEFRQVAERMEGSRDVGAQLFTALLRALSIEARLVGSLQPLGFGWTKAETCTVNPKAETKVDNGTDADGSVESEKYDPDSSGSESSEIDGTRKSSGRNKRNNKKEYDRDMPFPIFWAEVASPITHEIIPVDPLVLQNAVATTPELQAAFEPRGAKAEKAKQVICYIVAHSSDGTAKDVTTRYLRKRMWPGKTKGYRLPVERISVRGRRNKTVEYDWFKMTMREYVRPEDKRTVEDDIEDARDLVPNKPEKKQVKEGDTLQSLRSSAEFVLERFLRREEALRPGAKHVRTFVTGKGDKAKEEKIFKRSDVLRCFSAETWHKEGRCIKVGQAPLKRVPIRAVTLLRKREVDELERETGEKPKQGLYAKHQTEYIIPEPIKDGIIPKNDYGNIDCFVQSMIPRGAVHVPWPGTVRICKKLGIDHAEAVTGFEFGSKMAVPVIEGVVIAAENEGLLRDSWLAEEEVKRKREQLKAEKRILETWRKFLLGLRIAERVREEYGGENDEDMETDRQNPFSSGGNQQTNHRDLDEHGAGHAEDMGGGFLLPQDEDKDKQDDGNLVIEKDDNNNDPRRRSRPGINRQSSQQQQQQQQQQREVISIDDSTDGDNDGSESIQELSSPPQSQSDLEDGGDQDNDDGSSESDGGSDSGSDFVPTRKRNQVVTTKTTRTRTRSRSQYFDHK